MRKWRNNYELINDVAVCVYIQSRCVYLRHITLSDAYPLQHSDFSLKILVFNEQRVKCSSLLLKFFFGGDFSRGTSFHY